MDVRDAVATRFSCRAFLSTPVPLAVVRDILERAGRAPSGGNLQPWRVDALSGAARSLEGADPPAPRRIAARGGRRIRDLSRAAAGALRGAALRGRRAALPCARDSAPGPPGADCAICPQFRILRRAGRALRLDRP